MCIAEALLRIPDAATADRLIRDKLSRGDWERHLGGPSALVNASTWALMLTGKLTRMAAGDERDPAAGYERLVARLGEPVVRLALRRAMKLMADEFVMGRTIGEALDRARKAPHANARHSFDMLGEAAYTAADARRYADAYADAIAAIGASVGDRTAPAWVQPSISVKLSALHPRYELAQAGRVLDELVPTMTALAALAKRVGIGFTVDAEEADRLELSLEIFARLRRDPSLAGWMGLGLAVQAYQKRARAVVDWLVALAGARGRVSRSGWSRARTGTPRSSARRCSASRAIRCSRGRRTPTSRTSRAPRRSSTPATPSIRCSRRTTRTRSPGSRRTPPESAPPTSSSSACTAWASRSTRRSAPRRTATPAASTHRSAATRTCSRTSSADCSRTARTRRSCTGSPIHRFPSRTSSPTRPASPRATGSRRIRSRRCRAISSPTGSTRRASRLPTSRRWPGSMPRSPTRGRRVGVPA